MQLRHSSGMGERLRQSAVKAGHVHLGLLIEGGLEYDVHVLVPCPRSDATLLSSRLNLVCATGHFSLLMLCSFTNQVLAQVDLFRYWKGTTAYKNDVYLWPKQLDEK